MQKIFEKVQEIVVDVKLGLVWFQSNLHNIQSKFVKSDFWRFRFLEFSAWNYFNIDSLSELETYSKEWRRLDNIFDKTTFERFQFFSCEKIAFSVSCVHLEYRSQSEAKTYDSR